MSSSVTPTPADKFTFGLWAVGWQAHDPFGDPTLAAGETYHDLLDDDSAFERFDVDSAGARPHGASRIDQLALEHLLGAR